MNKPLMEPQWLTPEEIGALSDRDLKRFHRLCRRMLLLARVVKKPSELSPDDLATMVSLRSGVIPVRTHRGRAVLPSVGLWPR
jgi:hypothetical protein